jgi:glycerol uptake facilitator-like aquaporin
MPALAKRVVAEAVGTAFLLMAIVGSGIMAERLSGGNVAIALLANSIATGGALVAIISAFGPISGAHLNPIVTVADWWRKGSPWSDVGPYVAAQTVGAICGAGIANLMFGLPAFFFSHKVRTGSPVWLGETVATFGLLAVIWGCSRWKPPVTPFAVAAYIVGAYWFTSSTSLANPVVAIARSLSDTFAGIRPVDVPAFIVCEIVGGLGAAVLFGWLAPVDAVRARIGRPARAPSARIGT